MIIGLAGPARAGKDTVAGFIVERDSQYGIASFADPLKNMLMKGLSLDPQQLWGDLKDEVDTRYGRSPRDMLQTLGTEWGREMVGPDVWVQALAERINEHVVIADVRFENEAAFVRAVGILIHIKGRGGIDGDHKSERGVRFREGDLTIVNDETLGQLGEQVRGLSIWSQ